MRARGTAWLFCLSTVTPMAEAALPDKVYRGKHFEVRYPAGFDAGPVPQAEGVEAMTFTSPDGRVAFYVSSRPPADMSPDEQEGVAPACVAFEARDAECTRAFQAIRGPGGTQWIVGMKYRSESDRRRHRDAYARFRGSLRTVMM